MSTDLIDIFGSNIRVAYDPRIIDRSYKGFTGGHGLISDMLGSRGYLIHVSGRLQATGGTFAENVTALTSTINSIEAYRYLPADTYTYATAGITFNYVIFDKLNIVKDSKGKQFYLCAGGKVICFFTATLRSLF